MQAFDLAQQTAICWRPLWTVRGKPLPLPAVKLRRIIANTGRTKQAKNALEFSAGTVWPLGAFNLGTVEELTAKDYMA
jgi:hypothetical protein